MDLNGGFLGCDWNIFLSNERVPCGEYVFSLIHLFLKSNVITELKVNLLSHPVKGSQGGRGVQNRSVKQRMFLLLNASFMLSEASCSRYGQESVHLGHTVERIQTSSLCGIIFIATSFLLHPHPPFLASPDISNEKQSQMLLVTIYVY